MCSPPLLAWGFYLAAFHNMRNLTLETGRYYHIYNRGVDKRDIFLETEDYDHFLSITLRSKFSMRSSEKLVNIHAYTCMTNHFHFLIEQVQDRGIATFMQRMGTAYTRAFNRKYHRSGSLFETTYQAKCVNTDAYLSTVAAYIHRNPIGLPGIQTISDLDTYPWSSYPHYRGIVQDHLVDDEVLWDYFGGTDTIEKFHSLSSSNVIDDYEETH